MNRYVLLGMLLLAVLGGCKKSVPDGKGSETSGQVQSVIKLTLKPVREIAAGFKVPESVVVLKGTGKIFVSNIQTETEGYWLEDGEAFVQCLELTDSAQTVWKIDSRPDFPLHGPKGMAVCGDKLYFTDQTQLKCCDVATGENLQIVEAVKGDKLNDVASDGQTVLVTDMVGGKILQLMADGSVRQLKGPEDINGVTSWQGKIYAVSWGQHDLYEIDPRGEKEAIPFGLADHFTNLDGIELLKDGTFIVSDFKGNKVCAVSPDRKHVKTLVEMDSPADIGIDREKMLLYVPQFMQNKVQVFSILQNNGPEE